MQFLGGKLSAAQLQVAGWVGSVRRSLQGALELVWGHSEVKQEEEEDDKEEDGDKESGDGEQRFQRAISPLRSFTRRSRRSLRRFSVRGRQNVERRATGAGSVRADTQANSFCTHDEDKEAAALTDGEPHQQEGDCEETCDTDSSQPIADHTPEVSSDAADSHREPDLPALPESFAPLLDTTAQKSKADLGKRRIRSRPSRSFRAGSDPMGRPDWRAHDSTDGKEVSSKQSDSDSEEDRPKPKAVCSPPPAAQRVPVFPGMSPAALIAQIKKRTGGPGGGGEDTEEDKAREKKESENEEVAPSPSQLSQSPRSASKLAGAALVLPPLGGKDGGAASSPAWLKELRSKKRMSLHDGENLG